MDGSFVRHKSVGKLGLLDPTRSPEVPRSQEWTRGLKFQKIAEVMEVKSEASDQFE